MGDKRQFGYGGDQSGRPTFTPDPAQSASHASEVSFTPDDSDGANVDQSDDGGSLADQLRRASPLQEPGSSWPAPSGQADPPSPSTDPLKPLAGKSVSLTALGEWRWPTSQPYLDPTLSAVLDDVANRRGVRVIGLGDFLDGLMTSQAVQPTLLRTILARLDDMTRSVLTDPPNRQPPLEPAPPSSPRQIEAEPVLRWDLVDFLIDASANAKGLGADQASIGELAVLVTFFTSVSGQAAMRDAGLFENGYQSFRKFVAAQVDAIYREAHDTSLDEDRLRIAVGLLGDASLHLTEESLRQRMSYAPDRAVAIADDAMGVARDAQALCDLILLEAVRPPLAIGLFGPWGSGKSTLIKTLQNRVRAELQAAPPPDAQKNADTRRIEKAVQIELNAWTFADSPNLWASLTSEIFDQLASGGIDAADDAFAKIVEEVKHRSSRELATSMTTRASVSDAQSRLEAAQRQVMEARRQRSETLPAALADVVKAALDRPGPAGGAQKVQILFTEPVSAPEKSALGEIREALGDPKDGKDRAKSYAEAGSDMSRFLLVLRDYLFALRGRTALALLVFAVAVGLAWHFGGSRLVGWAGALLGFSGSVGLLAKPVLVAWRFAALLSRRLEERRTEAEAAVDSARAAVAEQEAKLADAQSKLAQSEAFVARYGGVTSANAASPGLMLDYLLAHSEDVEAVRAQLGLLAKVRRCFEQLDAIVKRKGSGVDRIILYIDDLDRCDATQVSQVLQAVHLLLAFECFVVIVAVDARWLKQSLEMRNTQFRQNKAGEATAADYLEKIFQIPFWVGGMIDEDTSKPDRFGAYRRFVDQLIDPASKRSAGPAGGDGNPVVGVIDGGIAAPTALIGIEPFKPRDAGPDVPRQAQIRLTDAERAWLGELGPLAAKSPRAVKRMINIYRLIRVKEARRIGPNGAGAGSLSYWAVAFALAVQVGAPDAIEPLIKCANVFLAGDGKSEVGDPAGDNNLANLLQLPTTDGWDTIAKLLQRMSWDYRVSPGELLAALEEVRRYSFQPRTSIAAAR